MRKLVLRTLGLAIAMAFLGLAGTREAHAQGTRAQGQAAGQQGAASGAEVERRAVQLRLEPGREQARRLRNRNG